MTTLQDRFSTGRNDWVVTSAETDRERAAAFLDPFGLGLDGGFVDDPSGYPLSLSAAWTEGLDRFAAAELARAGRAIARPDEIRLLWKRGLDGEPLLTRRYIARIGGVAVAADVNRADWCFATSEDPGFDLDKVRAGERAWAADS